MHLLIDVSHKSVTNCPVVDILNAIIYVDVIGAIKIFIVCHCIFFLLIAIQASQTPNYKQLLKDWILITS